jgi:hypothetical protein
VSVSRKAYWALKPNEPPIATSRRLSLQRKIVYLYCITWQASSGPVIHKTKKFREAENVGRD